MRASVLLLGVGVVIGCGKSTKGPFTPIDYNSMEIPRGSGWHCFTWKFSSGSGKSTSECERSKSDCEESRADSAKKHETTPCVEAETAYCFTQQGEDGSRRPASCSASAEDCDFGRQAHLPYGPASKECRPEK